jgi:phage N-6-adenine-methyltransferase
MAFTNHERHGKKGETDVWLTPLKIINALGDFDLDPCGERNHATAKTIYTKADDGLTKHWFGRVWLNPPYSEVELWLDQLANHGNGVALVFARLDTKWAHKYIPRAQSIFFLKGRISFLKRDFKTKGNAGAPSMFLSFGHIPNWSLLGDGLEMRLIGSAKI